MNNARKLTLEEIKNLPKASVIWREQFTEDEESGFVFYQLEPMLVCVPGECGVLAWANKYSFLDLTIDEDLLSGRSFWDKEPDQDMIQGVPESDFDRFINASPLDDFTFPQKQLLSTITRAGFSVPRFCQETGIDESALIQNLQSEKADESFLKKCYYFLNQQ